jgi:cyclic dehypoxanthinyl futalosine synthase
VSLRAPTALGPPRPTHRGDCRRVPFLTAGSAILADLLGSRRFFSLARGLARLAPARAKVERVPAARERRLEMPMLSEVEARVQAHERIDLAQAGWLFEHATNADLARLASAVRARFHRENEATYLIMAIVNYTNVCVAKCDYCSFYRLPGDPEGYLLSFEQVCGKIDQLRDHGGSLVGFNGGFHPELRIQDYADMFGKIHVRYPELEFFEMTVAEFMFACKVSKIPYTEGARILKEVGTRWVTGGGAEVLDEAFRKRHSPGKYKVADYYRAQRAILEAGMGSTATMVIGFGEPLAERLNHLQGLRAFQDDVGGALASFLCWTYKSFGNDLGGHEISNEEYLRWLSVCRLYLDNFVHIRTSVLTKNEGALEAMRYGANDFDLPTEDEVTQKAGAQVSHAFADVIGHAEKLGFRVVHRKGLPQRPTREHPYEATGLSNAEVLAPRPRSVKPDVPHSALVRADGVRADGVRANGL